MRVAPAIHLSSAEKQRLTQLANSDTGSAREVRRASIVLLAAQGLTNHEIAERLHVGRIQVGRWRSRYARHGLDGVPHDKQRAGRPVTVDADSIVRLTRNTRPLNATHWTSRTLAARTGVSAATILRIWRAHGLQPHRAKASRISRDPEFIDTLEDVVGLYMHPSSRALVLACGEKRPGRAPQHDYPGRSSKNGLAVSVAHADKRRGASALVAALNILDGTVMGQGKARHRHTEWLAFLHQINRETAQGKSLHLIYDDYVTYTHPTVRGWLDKHPRCHVHLTPTPASWLSMVEPFFRDITAQRLHRSALASVPDLIETIHGHVCDYNRTPKPFIWMKRASDILQAADSARYR